MIICKENVEKALLKLNHYILENGLFQLYNIEIVKERWFSSRGSHCGQEMAKIYLWLCKKEEYRDCTKHPNPYKYPYYFEVCNCIYCNFIVREEIGDW